MKILAVLLSMALFLTGCATTTIQNGDALTEFKPVLSEDKEALRASFVGKWLSKQPTKEGGMRETLVERFNDGQYLIEFKVYDAAGTMTITQKEFGVWGVSGGVYFTMYRGLIERGELYPSDPSDAYNYDSYRILETSQKQLEYLSLSSGNRFTYQKVE
ncbi:hypothetical protein [Marinomonas balearica]|uniref:Lipoprotein n=1 Tax=Marinomonas balearica TaxID=491947 RepID=A0A4R6MBX2_9GAMM|nr:hypothetical protein [Marinomonas balearica]TDO98974.1 hypothetical protein DFP79_1398 [Marinomonas balearica]